MKTNLLRLRRVLSATLFVLLLNVVGMTNAFGQTQVATLQHNDTISMYYGQNAFVEAYNACADGDIITLSSGTFTKCDIGKTITLRGAGCVADTATNVSPTIIPGTITFTSSNVTIEGVQFTGYLECGYSATCMDNLSFIKCNINVIENGHFHNNPLTNFQFIDCIINTYKFNGFAGSSIINCVIGITEYNQGDIYNPINVYNSVVLFASGLSITNIVANNSIIASVSGHNVSNCTFNNCIGIKLGDTSILEGQANTSNMEVNDYSDVFETFNGTVSFDENYNLKDEIINTFLGNDGSQVGIYGGMMPYNPRPSYMKIKRCNVASRSTIDGKLSVDIEIINEDN